MQSNSRGKNSNNANNEKLAEKNMERKLEQLEEMQDYCTQMKCRRNNLILHFGGQAVKCNATCDVCKDPKKVEQSMQASTAIKDVRNQQKFGDGGRKRGRTGRDKQPWDGQWNKPHGDFSGDVAIADDWGDDCLMAGDLRVTGPLEVDPGEDYSPSNATKKFGTGSGFKRASDILSKYESMENRVNRYENGNSYDGELPSKNSSKSINIPDHLKASLKAASDFTTASAVHQKKKKITKTLSSKDHASNAKKIQDKLEKMKAEQAKLLKSLESKNTKKAPPPPPAPLSFGKCWKR